MPHSRNIMPLYRDVEWQRKKAKRNYCNEKHPRSDIAYFHYTTVSGEQLLAPIRKQQTLGEVENKIIQENECIIINELKQQLL
jgi:hypothetical protein